MYIRLLYPLPTRRSSDLLDCKSEIVVTADGGYRAGRLIPLKQTTDDAIKEIPFVKRVIVLRRTGKEVPWTEGRDQDRKSTRLNSSHLGISYAVFCLKKKK